MAVSSPSPTTAPVPAGSGVGSGRGSTGVDGVRALAVAAVVTTQLCTGTGTGVSRGVDLLFVVTGFLITSTLVSGRPVRGRVDVVGFLRQSARRRVPGTLLVVCASAVATIVWWHDQLRTIVGATYSTFVGATNWWLVDALPSTPVTSGRPSLLEHLWAPSVEVQFGLVWSCVVLTVVGGVSTGSRPTAPRLGMVCGVALVLAIVATVTAVSLASDVLPARIVFGSDTRAAALFLGAAAAAGRLAVAERRPFRGRSRPYGDALVGLVVDGLGAALLAGVVVECVTGSWSGSTSDRSGPALFAAAAATALWCAVRPGGRLGRALDTRLLRWVGQRSFAVYLWSWPVTVVTRPGLDVDGPPWLLAVLRAAVIVGLADLTHRLVDLPLRRRVPDDGGRRRSTPPPPTVVLVASATALAAYVLVVGAGIDPSPVSALSP